jgi:hypothetical protein
MLAGTPQQVAKDVIGFDGSMSRNIDAVSVRRGVVSIF